MTKELRLKLFPHSLHWKGFSPVWTRWCWMKWALRTKPFPHSSHLWHFSSELGLLRIMLVFPLNIFCSWVNDSLGISHKKIPLCLSNLPTSSKVSLHMGSWSVSLLILVTIMPFDSTSSSISSISCFTVGSSSLSLFKTSRTINREQKHQPGSFLVKRNCQENEIIQINQSN